MLGRAGGGWDDVGGERRRGSTVQVIITVWRLCRPSRRAQGEDNCGEMAAF